MMSKQGFTGKALNAAHHIVAIKNIIKALMQGGWAAAALQALKYYWPQILTVALILILLPVIIVCCLPMMMFGFEGSTDSQITEMTAQAETVGEYFEEYDRYCEERTDKINTEIEIYEENGYEIVVIGDYMPENWFIALFSVSVENDLTGVTEQQVKDFVDNCIIYEVETADSENTESENTESETSSNKVTIKRLTAEEVMVNMNYSDSDKNWAELIFNTLESEGTDGNDSTYSN